MINLPNTLRLPGLKGGQQSPLALIKQLTTVLVLMSLSHLAMAVPAEPEVVIASDNGIFSDGSRHWDRIEVDWSPVSNADSYQIYQCADKDNIATCSLVDSVDAPTTRYEHVGPGFCAIHYYAAKACDSSGCSGFSPRSGGSTPSCQDKDWNTIVFIDQTGEWPEPDILTTTIAQGVNNVLAIRFDAKTAQNVRAIAGQFESFPAIGEEAPKRFAISKTRGDLGLETPPECVREIATDGTVPWEIAGKGGSITDDCELDYEQADSTYYLNIWHKNGCADPLKTVCRHRISSRYLDEPGFELSNISTRAAVDVGDNIAIGGFIVEAEGLTCVAIRGKGPSLSDQIPVFQLLPDPKIAVIDQATQSVLQMRNKDGVFLNELAINDNWQDGPTWLDLVGADLYRDLDQKDAALVTCVGPGYQRCVGHRFDRGVQPPHGLFRPPR